MTEDFAKATQETPNHNEKIRDTVDDIQELKDAMRCARNQIAYLLYEAVETQRADDAPKLMVKNWWQYTAEASGQNYETLCEHREAMIAWIAKEARRRSHIFALSTANEEHSPHSHS